MFRSGCSHSPVRIPSKANVKYNLNWTLAIITIMCNITPLKNLSPSNIHFALSTTSSFTPSSDYANLWCPWLTLEFLIVYRLNLLPNPIQHFILLPSSPKPLSSSLRSLSPCLLSHLLRQRAGGQKKLSLKSLLKTCLLKSKIRSSPICHKMISTICCSRVHH